MSVGVCVCLCVFASCVAACDKAARVRCGRVSGHTDYGTEDPPAKNVYLVDR